MAAKTTDQVFRPLEAHVHNYVPHAVWPAQFKTCEVCGKVVPLKAWSA